MKSLNRTKSVHFLIYGFLTIIIVLAFTFGPTLLLAPPPVSQSKIIFLVSDKMESPPVSPRGAKVTPYFTRWRLTYQVEGQVNLLEVKKIFQEMGLFDYYGKIYIEGKTDTGVTYSEIITNKSGQP